MGNPYAPKKKIKIEEVEEVEVVETPEVTEEAPEALPEDLNTVKEVLGWVGEDKGRAELVLAQENTSDSIRKTLVKGLEEILNG